MSSPLRRLTRRDPGPAGRAGGTNGADTMIGPVSPEAAAHAPADPAGQERCEMCGTAIVERHSHVVALERRSLMCTCRPCALLFVERGAGGGRYRAVPERYLADPSLRVSEAEWTELRIPVRLAFFFHNSDLGQVLAFYPSPAGATESLLSMDAWAEGLGASALVQQLEPDVEALLVRHTDADQDACLLVPIDVCYELVGLVRTYWKGFDGGTEAWERIDGFFAELAGRARPLETS